MALLLLLYVVLVGQRAVLFISTGEPVAIALGIALLVLPLLGLFALVVELRFGLRTQEIVKQLAAEGGLPVDDVPRRASGRYEREAADAAFPAYKAGVEAAPDDWRAWFRLGLAYDACGDRRRARQALRWAITLRRETGG
ncbi:tetratricopeptide repeat protein [Frigoribacterium sp. PhB24]|uniref:tetratricopeptide repeat protein n=1 Tax=Frigoribacterium sp. PhB24 TaxID=2485204 RepID=UPI000F4A9EBB|nr:tetratricopeptide repeat protein [Frigoribacterium sp. PhB24]